MCVKERRDATQAQLLRLHMHEPSSHKLQLSEGTNVSLVKRTGPHVAKHLFNLFNMLSSLLITSVGPEAVSSCSLIMIVFKFVLIQENIAGFSRTFHFLVLPVSETRSLKR